jgi:hypothetical protein
LVLCQHEYLDVSLGSVSINLLFAESSHDAYLRFSTGTVGPAVFALGVSDSIIIIVIVDLV